MTSTQAFVLRDAMWMSMLGDFTRMPSCWVLRDAMPILCEFKGGEIILFLVLFNLQSPLGARYQPTHKATAVRLTPERETSTNRATRTCHVMCTMHAYEYSQQCPVQRTRYTPTRATPKIQDTTTLDENVRHTWVEHQILNVPNISVQSGSRFSPTPSCPNFFSCFWYYYWMKTIIILRNRVVPHTAKVIFPKYKHLLYFIIEYNFSLYSGTEWYATSKIISSRSFHRQTPDLRPCMHRAAFLHSSPRSRGNHIGNTAWPSRLCCFLLPGTRYAHESSARRAGALALAITGLMLLGRGLLCHYLPHTEDHSVNPVNTWTPQKTFSEYLVPVVVTAVTHINTGETKSPIPNSWRTYFRAPTVLL